MKTCPHCGLSLNTSWFRSELRVVDGLTNMCRMCESLWRSEYRTKDEVKAKRSLYLSEYTKRHKQRNQNPEFLDKEKRCPTCRTVKPATDFNGAARRRGGLSVECKVCTRGRSAKYTENLRTQVYDLLGHTCRKCDFSDKRALQIDHVHGGGNEEHAQIKNAQKFLKKVIAEAATGAYQILCANCNWIKRHERDENPIGPRA